MSNYDDSLPSADELALFAYLDGELDGPDLAAFELRLASDPNLQARLRAHDAVSGFLREDADRAYEAAGFVDMTDMIMTCLTAEPANDLLPITARTTPQAKQADSAHLKKLPTSGEIIPLTPHTRESALSLAPAPASALPPTSRAVRTRKNVIVWASFGSIAAAAAALVFFVQRPPNKVDSPPVMTSATVMQASDVTSTGQRLAVATVKKSGDGPSKDTTPVDETVVVEDLEVGEGSTVIYFNGSSAVVWLHEREEGANP